MPTKLTAQDQALLLTIARDSIMAAVCGTLQPVISLADQSQLLREKGACFVTLTLDNHLRGCIGTLEAFQPLIIDVQTRAVQAAMEDSRFHPVTEQELPRIKIEISRLTPPTPLKYISPVELPQLLRPGVDGVILADGHRRATYLPQVWAQLPDPEEFLTSLCLKMGATKRRWREEVLTVEVYQVEEFHED